MWISFDNFLSILAPPITIVEKVDFTSCLNDDLRLGHRPVSCGHTTVSFSTIPKFLNQSNGYQTETPTNNFIRTTTN